MNSTAKFQVRVINIIPKQASINQFLREFSGVMARQNGEISTTFTWSKYLKHDDSLEFSPTTITKPLKSPMHNTGKRWIDEVKLSHFLTLSQHPIMIHSWKNITTIVPGAEMNHWPLSLENGQYHYAGDLSIIPSRLKETSLKLFSTEKKKGDIWKNSAKL